MFSRRSGFVLSKSQRGAVVLLLLLLLGFQIYNLSLQSVQLLPPDLSMGMELQKQLERSNASKKPKSTSSFQYNPNFLTDYQAYLIGLPTEAYDRLKTYRQTNQFIKNPEEFQMITQLSDAQFKAIEKQLKFSTRFKKTTKKAIKKKDINSATAEEFTIVSGVGKVLSERLVKYRAYLSGFSVLDQCYEVYGLDSLVVKRLFDYFEIQSQPNIHKLDLETASLSELEKTPYLNRKEAEQLIAYRTKNNQIDLAVLSELFVNSPNKLERLKLYLH